FDKKISFPQRWLTDPHLAGSATDGPSPPWPASSEQPGLRPDFFKTVWCQDTFNPTLYDVVEVAGALISAGLFQPDPINGSIILSLLVLALMYLINISSQP